jgi:hypothetical protein
MGQREVVAFLITKLPPSLVSACRGPENLQELMCGPRQIEKLELVATARLESEVIRGEGDGERNRVFAEAFSKKPEFLSFYRSMQAYSKSLGGAATTLVLDPAISRPAQLHTEKQMKYRGWRIYG